MIKNIYTILSLLNIKIILHIHYIIYTYITILHIIYVGMVSIRLDTSNDSVQFQLRDTESC